ncbi:MAG: hypothetical protein EBZ67_01660 [Chitinophagia bacterium]|nr:hypothetical protein [Chitinophagia bacterium]
MNTFSTTRKGRSFSLAVASPSRIVLKKVAGDFDESISAALRFLRSRQRRNGGFNVYRASSLGFENWDLRHSSMEGFRVQFSNEGDQVLPALMIGRSLLHLSAYEDAERILRKITGYIWANRLPGSLWKNNRCPDGMTRSMPVDIQSTAMALSFLRERGESVKVPRGTLFSNRDRQGLFHTFLMFRRGVKPSLGYWRAVWSLACHRAVMSLFGKAPGILRDDVSVPMNAYMLQLLGECPATEPIVEALKRMISEGTEGDRYGWYRDAFTVYRHISTACRMGVEGLEELRDTIVDRVFASYRPDGSFNGEVTDTARAICILLDFGVEDSRILRSALWLLSKQNEDGSWDRRAAYFDAGKSDTVVSFGSEDIVTALCLEAVCRSIGGKAGEQP